MKIKDDQLTPVQIDEICALYKLGVKKLHIAQQFNKHHSTIIYHIAKRERQAGGNFLVKKLIPKNTNVISEPHSRQFILQRVKSYKDYEQEELDKKLKRRASCCHTEIVVTYKCKDCGEVHTLPVHSDTFWLEYVLKCEGTLLT